MVIKDSYYLGIEMNARMAMISYFADGMTEPDTVRTLSGMEYYQFPLELARRRNGSEWYFGNDAQRMVKEGDAVPVTELLSHALSGDDIQVGEESFSAADLMARYLKHLIGMTGFEESRAALKRIILVLDTVTGSACDLFSGIMEALGYPVEDFLLIDRKSAFCSFALVQKEPLWTHDVYLFDYQNTSMSFYQLTRYTKVRPQIVSIKESRRYAISEDKDRDFTQLLQRTLEGKKVSSVYLVGDGFDGGWMKVSLNYLCRGRRAFIGKNLYSKGACYTAWIMDNRQKWPFVYLGENDMKFSLSLPVRSKGRMTSLELVQAGTHMEQVRTSATVIVDGSMELDVYKRLPMQKEAQVETLVMEGFPKRKERMTRLQISLAAVSDSAVELTIQDLGFGGYYKSSGKTWHFTVSV